MNIKNKTFINESGEHFALAYAYYRNNQINEAGQELDFLIKSKPNNPMLINLEATLLIKKGSLQEATDLYLKGLLMFPTYRAFVYVLADHYIRVKHNSMAIDLLQKYLLLYPKDPNLYELMAKAYANLGRILLQHENLAEAFYYRYNLREAISLMDLAVRSRDGNFYEKSRVESRLKELKTEELLFKKSLN